MAIALLSFKITSENESLFPQLFVRHGNGAVRLGWGMTDGHVTVRSSKDWISVADRELSNLVGSYKAHLTNDAKIDHALRATEAMLKAVVWKRHKWPTWPKNNKPNKYLYAHNFEGMLDQTTLRMRLRASAEHWTSWQVLVNAGLKHFRYSPDLPSDAETNEVAKATRFPETGVVPWLRERYHEMT